MECNRERLVETPQRMSRHWYDLFMLQNSAIGKEALQRFDILENVIYSINLKVGLDCAE